MSLYTKFLSNKNDMLPNAMAISDSQHQDMSAHKICCSSMTTREDNGSYLKASKYNNEQ